VAQVDVLITGALHEDALAAFRATPSLMIRYHPDCSRQQLLELVPSAQVLVTRSETDVDAEVIELAKNLNVIARAAVGVGNIDIPLATTKGILVINCPGKNTNSAAELTFGMLLGMMRNLPQAHATVKGGGWDRHRFTGRELRGKRIGIVGLGNVGHRVAKFARGFDMEVFAYDPYIAPEVFERNGARPAASLQELATQVDVLTVHVPLNKETKGMVTGAVLDLMPRGSWVVNAARGGVIHERDLVGRLSSGQIAGAAIDTWESEPKPLPALVEHPRVWAAPHIGASTVEAQLAIGATIVEQVKKALAGGVVDYPVNLPQVAVIDNPLLKAYAVLAEKLGALVGQIIDFNPAKVEVSYRGNLAGLDHALVRLSWMKGYASQVVDDFVSFVNVESHVDRLGIRIVETEDPDFQSYKSAIKVRVHGPQGKLLTVGGIVFDASHIRISLINDFYFELEPSGTLIMVENDDRPGVIGDVGHYFAKNGINIDSFELSRNRKGGKAMALIKIDGDVESVDVTPMLSIKNVTAVRKASL
jgi:D-3-phosphoglycerate dehydrogenase